MTGLWEAFNDLTIKKIELQIYIYKKMSFKEKFNNAIQYLNSL